MDINLSELLGMNTDEIILCLAGIIVLLFFLLLILQIINAVKIRKLKRKYKKFMGDEDGKSLENVLYEHIGKIDQLVESNEINKKKIDNIENKMGMTFQKIGLVKYDAFNEMGGKLSFSLALLNEKNDGFIINAMHSREGCYTYIKEIIAGKSIIALAKEEQEALEMSLNYQ